MRVGAGIRRGAIGVALAGVFAAVVAPRHDYAQAPTEKAPVPSAEARREAKALVADVYRAQYDRAKTAAEKSALAAKMIGEALAPSNDAASRYVLLEIAGEVAAGAGDAELALQAANETAQRYAVDAMGVRRRALKKAADNARTSSQYGGVTRNALVLTYLCIKADDYDSARELMHLAVTSAPKSMDARLRARVATMRKQVKELEAQFAKLEAPLATLEKEPGDPQANLAVGRYRCFFKGDWDAGLSMLALGSDVRLRELAQKELRGATDTDSQVALADGWWNVGQEDIGVARIQVIWHAKSWYRKALPQLAGLVRKRVDRRLQSFPPDLLAKVLDWLYQDAVLRMTFDAKTFARRGKTLVVQDLSGENNHGVVHGTKLVAGKVREALSFTPQDFVDCGNAPSLDPAGGEFAISVWVKPHKGPDYPRIISKWGTYQLRWQSYYTDPGPVRFYGVYGGVQLAQNPPYDQWHHLVIVRRREGNDFRLVFYVNGQEAASAPSPEGKPDPRDGHLYIGVTNAGHQWEHYQGIVDELAIFPRALSAQEVDWLYCAGFVDENPQRPGSRR